MNYIRIDRSSVSNGLGVRVVLWVAGCSLHCQGCFNQETWNFNAGKPFDEIAERILFEYLSRPYIKGITFSGGHPLEDKNITKVTELIHKIRETFPDKDIWLYTGYELNYERDFAAHANSYFSEAVKNCDYVVDGAYVEKLRNPALAFRGSSNQRIIDVKKTLINNEIVKFEGEENI